MYRQRQNSHNCSRAVTGKYLGLLKNCLENNRFGQDWRIENTLTLAALVICNALTFALYLSTLAKIPGTSGDKRSFRSIAKVARPGPGNIPAFRLSGIALGMTPIEVGSVHPSISMSGPPRSRQTGRLKIANGDYSVSFMGPEAGRKSYRIHYTETFRNFSESEVQQRLDKKFAPPRRKPVRL